MGKKLDMGVPDLALSSRHCSLHSKPYDVINNIPPLADMISPMQIHMGFSYVCARTVCVSVGT